MDNENCNFFAILSRMKYVNRWGLMRNSRNESLSDHTLDVIFIAQALVVTANRLYDAGLDEGRVIMLAALHDAPEIITGDLPTPVKYFDPEIKRAYDHVESSVIEKMISTLPEEMRDTYRQIMTFTGPEDEKLKKYVKAADKISALIKCIEEERSGNCDFERAKESTLEAINKMDMPEVRYFLDKFLPGYYMTLDEQTKI